MGNDPAAHPPLTERYLLGELSDAERAEFEAHYFQCSTCAEDVLAGSAFVHGARAALTARRAVTAGEAREERRSWFRRLFEGSGFAGWGLRTAAVGALPLVALVAYQGLHTIPQLRQQIALHETPRAVTSVTLRPLTRGAAIVVPVGAADPSILLAMDLPPTAAGSAPLAAEVVDAGGRPVVPVFAVPRPAAGDPLQVSLATARLSPGAHELVIQTDGRVLARFPFTVERR
jgi:hypothetical protein